MAPSDKASIKASRFNHDAYPPIERFQTIDGLLKHHAKEQDQKPLICYPNHGVEDFEEHTAADIDRYTDAAVTFYINNGVEQADAALEKAPVIALLAPSSMEVILTIFALNRLGYAILFLSTRLTAPAYARLLEMVECHNVIHSPNFDKIIPNIRKDCPSCIDFPLLRREDWKLPAAEAVSLEFGLPDRVRQSKKIAWILHSSGSTGFPKPIFLTNLQCLANFRKSFGMRAFTASPLFHSGGLMELFRAFYTRAPMYLANHSLPITATNMLKAITAAKPKLVIAVPYVLKLFAEKEEGVKALAAAELVLFNGSGCPDDLGDRLVAAGVNLVANYGATETGQLMTSYRGIPPTDTEWSYLRLWPPIATHTLMDEIAPGVFEAVGLEGLPSKGPRNSEPPFSDKNPENSFRTADLFTRHPDPQKKDYYRYLSRLDDRITLSLGEKVLPLPIEGRIRQEDIVREAVVFGLQQTLPGVLVFRPDDKVLDMSDEQYLEAVWPAVEAANARAETFARIPKEMVVIMGPDAEYAQTAKQTFIRAQVYQQYDSEIKAAYARLDKSSGSETERLKLSVGKLEEWLLSRFREDLRVPLPSIESDIFAAGVDSLQTTRIWRSIKQKLDLGARGDSLSTNIVYECGTVARLARHLHIVRTGEADNESEKDEIETMKELIEKYSDFRSHEPTTTVMPNRKTILLTGATGNLGAFILEYLLQRDDVQEVCTLVRAPDQGAAIQRVLGSLSSRQIPLTAQGKAKLRPLPCDLSAPDLGLGPYAAEHLLSNVSCVIHSAWAVNFNLGVRSFEEQHIRGTYNLLNFCLRSHLPQPATFYFCSSVSAASGTPKPATIPETAVQDLRHAQATGYGRSKLVSEHITHNASRKTGVGRVLRIGQLCGDTRAGIWNDTEAIPLMIRSALSVGALPALDERPSWLPVDVCAKAICEIALTSSLNRRADSPHHEGQVNRVGEKVVDEDLVYHLVNPHTFSFRTDLLRTLRRLEQCGHFPKFDVVPPKEWLEKLASSEQDPANNPSIKLIDFWQAKYGEGSSNAIPADDIETAGLIFETRRTVEACPVLAKVRDPVSDGLIGKYTSWWLKSWT